MRADAQNHRRRLIAAAAKVMRERGHTVALQEVADSAGLGRGTLYRHFSDREALIIVVIEHELDAAEELIASCSDDRAMFFTFLDSRSASAAVFIPALLSLDSERLHGFFVRMRPRYDRLLSIVVERARRAGLLRPDYTTSDLSLTIELLSVARERCEGGGGGQLPARLVDFLMHGIGLPEGAETGR